MNLQEFQNKVCLPATDDLLNKLLSAYCNNPENEKSLQDLHTDLYKSINITNCKNKGTINNQDRDNWRKYLLSEVNNANFQIVKPPAKIQIGWFTYQSWKLIGGEKFHSTDIAHRFYICMNASKIHKFSQALYEKYKTNKIPFYFKISAEAEQGRKDNVVIYTTNKYFADNVRILNELEKEQSECFKTCEEPSLLVGKMTNHIGYASEPSDTQESYTGIICKILEQAIENTINKMILWYPTLKINFKGQQFSLEEFYSNNLTWDKRKSHAHYLTKFMIEDSKFSKWLFSEIRNLMVQNNVDINNICCNKNVFKNLQVILDQQNKTIINI